MNIPAARHLRARSICIIGAGASGLAAAKSFLAEHAFERITIFEQRAAVGGLWVYGPSNPDDVDPPPVPQTDPHAGLSAPIWNKPPAIASNEGPSQHAPCDAEVSFASPVYDRLETNIPTDLMGYAGNPWSKDVPLFPTHKQVRTYLERFADEVRHLITLSTQVLDVRHVSEDNDGGAMTWRVTTRDLTTPSAAETQTPTTHEFDAVYVASGHFDSPYIPDVPGICGWVARHPGRITHAKMFRRPEAYTGQKVLIVGNSASGADIGAQIAKHCAPPIIQSVQSESFLLSDASTCRVERPAIAEFLPDSPKHGSRAIRFNDGSVETGVDAVVYCTGYLYSLPFLQPLNDATLPSSRLITTGLRVENLYQHLFYIPNPTLAFAVLNHRIIPFQLAQSQSAVVSRVWAGRLGLPSEKDMREWEASRIVSHGDGRPFHMLPFPDDAEYINFLHAWWTSSVAETASRETAHGSKHSLPPPPPFWDERAYWLREHFAAIKKKYQDLGESRWEKRTLAEVGYDFEAWKRKKALEDAAARGDGDGAVEA